MALSFAAGSASDRKLATAHSQRASLTGREFIVCELIVSFMRLFHAAQIPEDSIATESGIIAHIAPGVEDWMTVAVSSQPSHVVALASHPSKHIIATASYSGRLHVWNYQTRNVSRYLYTAYLLLFQLDVNGRFDDVSKPQSLAFSPDGFTNGSIRILDSISLSLLTDKCDFRYVTFMR